MSDQLDTKTGWLSKDLLENIRRETDAVIETLVPRDDKR